MKLSIGTQIPGLDKQIVIVSQRTEKRKTKNGKWKILKVIKKKK